MSESDVKVFVRFRPLMPNEQNDQNKSIALNISADHKSLHLSLHNATEKKMDFTCDQVFDTNATQEEVFEALARGMVEEVVNGYNATIFAYGQTGSGKTHCMFGPGKARHELGIIPRSANHLFEVLHNSPDIAEATVKISLLEIYNEKIRDLFVQKEANLKIRETSGGTSYVAGLHEEYVASGEELMALLEIGSANRATGETLMNKVSSRSHCVLIIVVSTKSRDGTVRTGKLNLADLAGSEKVKSTGATGQTLIEAKKINMSLSALGNCIHALTEENRSHVPYRDSKLTYLLKDSLGGNTKTALIVACSPAARNGEETYSTLQFAQRAKLVKNSVSVNTEQSVEQLTELVNTLRKQIADLKSGNPSSSNEDMIEALNKDKAELAIALAISQEEKAKVEEEFKNYRLHVEKHWAGRALKRTVSNSRSLLRMNTTSYSKLPEMPPTPCAVSGDSSLSQPVNLQDLLPSYPVLSPKLSNPTLTPTPPSSTLEETSKSPNGPIQIVVSEEHAPEQLQREPSLFEAQGLSPPEDGVAEEEAEVVGDVGKLLSENVRLTTDNEALTNRVIELNRQILEMKLRQVGDSPSKIVKPMVSSQTHASAIEMIQGTHLIDAKLEEDRPEPVVVVTVWSCGASMDVANASLVNRANNFLQRFKWLRPIENLRHHWAEFELGEGLGTVLVQKHPNGNISADFSTDTAKIRELALEVAGIHCRYSASFEDVTVEGELKSPCLTVNDLLGYVKKQPAKYRSITLNSKDFALSLLKWCKQIVKKQPRKSVDDTNILTMNPRVSVDTADNSNTNTENANDMAAPASVVIHTPHLESSFTTFAPQE